MNDQEAEPDPEIPCSVEELWAKFQVIPGFTRLAVSCGCPTTDGGRLVPAVLFGWITDHYEEMRAAAGLPALAEAASSDLMVVARCKAKNTLLTFADYAESRSSDRVMKEAWQDTRGTIAEH